MMWGLYLELGICIHEINNDHSFYIMLICLTFDRVSSHSHTNKADTTSTEEFRNVHNVSK